MVIQSVAEKLRNSDKELVYINALDTADDDGKEFYKTWEDVLDVIVKLRFSSGVTVLDMGTLRRQYLERNEGRVLFLFKEPIELNVFEIKLSKGGNVLIEII